MGTFMSMRTFQSKYTIYLSSESEESFLVIYHRMRILYMRVIYHFKVVSQIPKGYKLITHMRTTQSLICKPY